jgi:hypothetical protein
MDTTLAALIFALAALAVVTTLLWRSQNRGRRAEASWSFGEIFTTIALECADTATAEKAVTQAATQRGQTADSAGKPQFGSSRFRHSASPLANGRLSVPRWASALRPGSRGR